MRVKPNRAFRWYSLPVQQLVSINGGAEQVKPEFNVRTWVGPNWYCGSLAVDYESAWFANEVAW